MEKNLITPDPLSLVTHHLQLGFSKTDIILSSATGFIYKFQDVFYIITTWHNVTGRDPITGQCISEHGGIPDLFATYFRSRTEGGVTHREILPLYADAEMEKPLWLEHPISREKIDVVAYRLPAEIATKYRLFPINEIPFEEGIAPEVSDEVFILGYPFSETPYLHLPVWKKASIATEPTVNIDQLPKLLVDTATRPGLSGSPAIFQRTGTHKLGQDGMPTDETFFGRARDFIGIYSGRIGKDEFQAQLGIIWKKRVIQEIVG
jgi:hypothetical protein